jgi:uncharacterized protein with PIN domain
MLLLDNILFFGKGSFHSAALNFGDVFSHALAKVRGLPLLFKGSDLAETDLYQAPVNVTRGGFPDAVQV